MSEPVGRLREIVARLRAPDGCPWDREQTHASLRGALLEETYELVEAIDLADDSNLREELGDLLPHVVMHAQMASERGAFEFDAVATEICEKLIRRHPHVFGDQSAADSDEVLRQWEQIKRAEKTERTSILDGLPRALPALMRAQNAQKKAARVGFDWTEAGEVIAKIEEELAELKSALAGGDEAAVTEETGDLFFSVVNLARKLGQDSEMTLNAATDKFVTRFKAVERLAAEAGRRVEDCSADELNAYWGRPQGGRGVSDGFVVLNPGGRDAEQSFANGVGAPGDAGHPPVNYHGYAACMGGAFLRDVKSVPAGTRAVVVLLRKRNLRAVLKTLATLQARGVRTWISLKESGAHQVADFLADYDRSLLFRRICAASDGYLSSTPDLESLYRAAGCRDGFFAPTPYPIEEPAWDRGIPLAERKGIFVGTREFDVPSRNHWRAVAVAAELGRELEVPVAVMSNFGRHGLRLLKAIRGDNPFLHFIVGPFAYRDYLRLMAAHRIVFQLDASAVPGQVAGDALLCRLPCVGGNGAVERIAFEGLAGDERAVARRLLTDDAAWNAAMDSALKVARERLSFSAVRALLTARMNSQP